MHWPIHSKRAGHRRGPQWPSHRRSADDPLGNRVVVLPLPVVGRLTQFQQGQIVSKVLQRGSHAVYTENSDTDVVVMQSTEESMRHDAAGPLDRARDRRIFVQRSVRSRFIVISGIGF
jgi:hypothetical protein